MTGCSPIHVVSVIKRGSRGILVDRPVVSQSCLPSGRLRGTTHLSGRVLWWLKGGTDLAESIPRETGFDLL